MKKRIAVYGCLVLFSLYLFFMYSGSIWNGLLILEFIYPLLSGMFLWRAGRKIEAGFGMAPAMAECERRYEAEVKIRNTSRLWGMKYQIRMRIGYRMAKKLSRRKVSGILFAGRESTSLIQETFSYGGNYEIRLESIRIYDLFGIFYRTIRLTESRTIGIMPVVEPMPVEITRRTRDFLADADEYSTEKSGDDPSEVYQIREYRAEDSIQKIHWKLSAKEDTLMVKEHGLPLGASVLIWIHLSQKAATPKRFGEVLRLAAALSFTLCEEKCIHVAAWFEEKNQRIAAHKINSEEALYECLWHLLFYEPVRSEEMEQSCYEEAFPEGTFSTVTVIDETGGIQVNGKKQELPEV